MEEIEHTDPNNSDTNEEPTAPPLSSTVQGEKERDMGGYQDVNDGGNADANEGRADRMEDETLNVEGVASSQYTNQPIEMGRGLEPPVTSHSHQGRRFELLSTTTADPRTQPTAGSTSSDPLAEIGEALRGLEETDRRTMVVDLGHPLHPDSTVPRRLQKDGSSTWAQLVTRIETRGMNAAERVWYLRKGTSKEATWTRLLEDGQNFEELAEALADVAEATEIKIEGYTSAAGPVIRAMEKFGAEFKRKNEEKYVAKDLNKSKKSIVLIGSRFCRALSVGLEKAGIREAAWIRTEDTQACVSLYSRLAEYPRATRCVVEWQTFDTTHGDTHFTENLRVLEGRIPAQYTEIIVVPRVERTFYTNMMEFQMYCDRLHEALERKSERFQLAASTTTTEAAGIRGDQKVQTEICLTLALHFSEGHMNCYTGQIELAMARTADRRQPGRYRGGSIRGRATVQTPRDGPRYGYPDSNVRRDQKRNMGKEATHRRGGAVRHRPY